MGMAEGFNRQMWCACYLFDLGLQVTELNALLQVTSVLLCGCVQLLLLLMQEIQQVLHPRGHVNITIT